MQFRLVGWLTDITDRKRNEDRLKHDAWHDALTDLPNRAYFRGQLQRAATRSYGRPHQGFALLYLDVDNFKELNDGLGHTVGDQVLIAIANRLKNSVRPGDTIARIGGDEFAILLARLGDEREATHIAERIQKALALPVKVGANEHSISLSIGIALSSLSHDKPGDFLRDADAAMYQAKADGGGRHRVFEKGSGWGDSASDSLADDLEKALDRGELQVLYQAIIALPAGRVAGCAAVPRWEHDSKGVLTAADFELAAEQKGLTAALQAWLLQEACSQMKQWLDAGLDPERLTVEISPAQLRQSGLVDSVQEALARNGLEPSAMRLEMAENALLEISAESLRALEELSAAGLQISVGDLGMEYSSLIYLKRFPISHLKIDGQLIRDLHPEGANATITAGLIELAHSLGLQVTVDNIGTPEQLAFLRSKRCDEFQGSIISAALDAEAFGALMRTRTNLLPERFLSSAS